mgnify:CR=1 FL=1
MDDSSIRPSTPTVAVETSVSRVTFFEDRAEVMRVARCSVPRGRSRVQAHGITLLVDDRSLTCGTGGNEKVEIVFSRIRRRSEDVAGATVEELEALEADLERARERLARADRGLGKARADGQRVAAMMKQWAEVVRSVPSRAEVAAGELGSAYDAIDVATGESLDALARLRREREEAQVDAARVELRLLQARAKKPRFEAFAELEIVATEATEVAIEIVYRTPCALWRPEHLARLTRTPDGKGEISITTYAAVWQLTGEVWKDVPCRFSTARPARSAMAPDLREDVLTTRRKTNQERRQVVVEAREQTIAVAGIARGKRDVDEMPGVEDGGEAQWLAGRSAATIESDGRPVRVEVGERSFACTVARVCFPELGPATHLRATATLPGPAPLLPGPITVARETEIVGRSTIGFVGAGEPFELGFGVDDGLRVRRRVVEKRKTTPVTGTQHVAREIWLYVSNLSGDARPLSIVERVPVSEVEDVRVEVDPHMDMRHDERDGFATFALSLGPRATREIVLKYRIEAESNVVLPLSLDL